MNVVQKSLPPLGEGRKGEMTNYAQPYMYARNNPSAGCFVLDAIAIIGNVRLLHTIRRAAGIRAVHSDGYDAGEPLFA